MPAPEFVEALNEQVAHEFGASQQYVAVAVHYDQQTLPRLANFFYGQAVEERGHAMKMIQYLMDQDAEVIVPPIAGPRNGFADIVEPIAIALDQEKRVSEQITRLARIARETGDYQSEQFIQWFLKEQVEEVSTMGDLLTTVRRSAANPLWVEEFLAREGFGGGGGQSGAPPTAGGDL